MSNIISLAAVRAERLKQALSLHARNGDAVIIETRTGPVAAAKINCSATFAEVLNHYGDYFVVDYADIRAVRPQSAAQTSVVDASGDFLASHDLARPARSSAVLAFSRRSRR